MPKLLQKLWTRNKIGDGVDNDGSEDGVRDVVESWSQSIQ